MIKNKIIRNASWIVGCRIVQSVLALIVTMLSARYLGPSNYGLINYAASVVSFMTPIMTLGLNNILVQEFVNDPQREGEVLGTSLVLSSISAVACIFGISSFVAVANAGEKETIIVCILYSLILVSQAFELTQYWFQSKYLSKYTAMTTLAAYILVSAYKIFLLIAKKSIYWFALSNALDYFLIAIALLVIYKKLGGGRLIFSKETAKRLFSRSRYYIVSSLMITVFAQTDKIMLKLMIDDAATGFYAAAVQSAGLTNFVFAAIIDSFRPFIFENVKNNKEDFEKSMCQLYSVVIYLSLLQSLFMTLFAPLIVSILYGPEYTQTVSALQLVVWYTTFSYLGGVRNIWILADGKQKYLWIINLSGALANVILNFILIPVIGIMGAALASLITQIFTNLIIGYIIKPIRPNNALMVRSLNPKFIFGFFRR